MFLIADSRRPILRSPETGMVMKELFGKRRAQRCPSYHDLYIMQLLFRIGNLFHLPQINTIPAS
jgi:hypothetical protein